MLPNIAGVREPAFGAPEEVIGMAEIERRALAMPGTPFEGTLEEHREIRRAVRELKDLMGEYRVDMDASAWRSWMAGLSRKLLALHDRLCSHFLEEERSG